MKLKIIAIMMICLIVFFPVSAFALQVVSRSGADQVEGFIKRADTITVKVASNAAAPEKLKFFTNYEYGRPFTSCEGNVCTFTGTQIDYTGYVGPSITANIGLYDDQNILLEQASTVLGFDDQKPEISISAPSKIGGQNISVNYNVRDKTTGSSSCSGVSKIQFFIDDSMIQEKEITPACSGSGTLNLDSSNFQEGSIALKAKAVDMMGLESDFVSVNTEVDLTPPIIDAATFKLMKGNAVIEYSNGNEIDVSAQLSPDIKEAYGNFNSLNINGGYDNVRAACSAGVCSWNLRIKIRDSAGSIHIKAVDTAGNIAETDFVPNIIYDTVAPQVIKLRSAVMSQDKSILNNLNNTIVAEISENGKIDPHQVFLDLSAFGLGKRSADECIAGWTCYWKNIPAAGSGTKSIMLLAESTDNAGNHFQSIVAPFYIDASSPIINSIIVRNIGSIVPAYEGFAKTWDSLAVDMFITEENGIENAVLDASRFITGAAEILATNCEDTGKNNIWRCQWQTAPIDITGHLTGQLKFTITDKAGNLITAAEPFEVFEISNMSETNFFSNSVKCSPDKIDRQVTKLLNQRVYCHVSLTGDADVMQAGLGECAGGDIGVGNSSGNSMDFIQNIEVMNSLSKDPYLKVTLVATDMQIDDLPIKCQLLVNSKSGNKINTIPEIEEVNFVIKFYNMPLGEYSSSVQDKIDKSKEAGKKGIWGLIGKLQKLLSYVDKFCTLYYSIIGIVEAIQKISTVWASLADGLRGTPVGIILEGGSRAQQKGQEIFQFDTNKWGWTKFFNKMCKWSSCRLWYEPSLTEDAGAKADKEDGKKPEKKGLKNRLFGWISSKKTEEEKRQKYFNRIGKYDRIAGQKVQSAADYLKVDTLTIMNPKDSLILSLALPCIPGIIYNLDKYRQIKCLYATCLEENAKANLPLQACDDQKAYSTCKYVIGEVFSVIGIFAIFDYIINIVKNALSDPLAAVDVAFSYVCTTQIEGPSKIAGAICLIEDVLSQIGDAISDFQSISDGINNWKKPVDYCD